MTHSYIWLTETATRDMLALIGTAMLKGASKEELLWILDCIEGYILSSGREYGKYLEYLYTKYPIDHMPDIAELYFNIVTKGAKESEVIIVRDYYFGFNNSVFKSTPNRAISELKKKYIIRYNYELRGDRIWKNS